ncbi:DEAD/DEAH box helicase [Thiospirochaeta perfilievii]|nr:DEAD/DEAH box helicase [Thiospirochaeta perfilievii]
MKEYSNNFLQLGLVKDICFAVADRGYKEPTQIQKSAIPLLLNNNDLIGVAQTGTGKTASFTLPLLNKLFLNKVNRDNGIRSLILVPTRELAIQVGENVKHYNKYIKLKINTVLGGVNINPQMISLRGGADILIATPGRLLDLFDKNAINFKCLETLVLDEADKLLDLGFEDELNRIHSLLPNKVQTVMFSATFSNSINLLSSKFLKDPVEVRIEEEVTTAEGINEWLYPVDKSKKNLLLLELIHTNSWDKVLVFAKSQNRVDRLVRFLENKGVNVDSIHGKKTQFARTETLDKFKGGKTRVLVATDIASRGIDISKLPVVVNYDMPHVAENYIHRIGRTGRAGNSGLAISFCCEDEFDDLIKVEHLLQTHITRELIVGFEPKSSLKTSPRIKPLKPKKPKKKKSKTQNIS